MLEYRKLRVWNEATDLAVLVYDSSSRLPDTERFGVQSQVRRAALSIQNNIAEGAGRGTNRDFMRFLRMSIGSCNEVESIFLIGHRLGYFDEETVHSIETSTSNVRKMALRV